MNGDQFTAVTICAGPFKYRPSSNSSLFLHYRFWVFWFPGLVGSYVGLADMLARKRAELERNPFPSVQEVIRE